MTTYEDPYLSLNTSADELEVTFDLDDAAQRLHLEVLREFEEFAIPELDILSDGERLPHLDEHGAAGVPLTLDWHHVDDSELERGVVYLEWGYGEEIFDWEELILDESKLEDYDLYWAAETIDRDMPYWLDGVEDDEGDGMIAHEEEISPAVLEDLEEALLFHALELDAASLEDCLWMLEQCDARGHVFDERWLVVEVSGETFLYDLDTSPPEMGSYEALAA